MIDPLDAFSNAGLVERIPAPRKRKRERAATTTPAPSSAKAPVLDSRTWKERAASFAKGGPVKPHADAAKLAAEAAVVLAFLHTRPDGATWPELDAWMAASSFGRKPGTPAPTGKRGGNDGAKSLLVQCLAHLETTGAAFAADVKLPRLTSGKRAGKEARRTKPVRWCAGRRT